MFQRAEGLATHHRDPASDAQPMNPHWCSVRHSFRARTPHCIVKSLDSCIVGKREVMAQIRSADVTVATAQRQGKARE